MLLILFLMVLTGIQFGLPIEQNDSGITILINSTFEIIEDFDLLQNETSEGSEESSAPRKPIRLSKIRPPSILVNCQRYSEAEKYRILEDAGGRNQLFMADSVDEAARNFADLFPDSPVDQSMQDHVQILSRSSGSSSQRVRQALNNEIRRRNSTQLFRTRSVLHDTPGVLQTCNLGNFIPIGTCTDLGEPVAGGTHESLCSECRGLYMLTSNCFPQIFNAVQCNSQEMGCIFDTFTDMAHGQCGLQTLSFKVLRNNGDENCEDWIVEQIQLPVACQCALSKSSFLKTKPSKEL